MNVLVINCGSSSLKFQLINAKSEEVLAKGICERIGIDGRLTYQPEGGEKEKSEKQCRLTQRRSSCDRALTNPETGVVNSWMRSEQWTSYGTRWRKICFFCSDHR